MSLTSIFFIYFPIFSFFICLILALNLYRHYRAIGSLELSVLLSLAAMWGLFYTLKHLNLNDSGLFWLKISYFSTSLIPLSWLLFSVRFSYQKKLISRHTILLLLIIPILINILIWLPGTEHLMLESYQIKIYDNVAFYEFVKGDWYQLYEGYLYSMLLMGIVSILIRLNLYKGIFKKQSLGIIVGVIIPLLTKIIYLTNLFPFLLDDMTATSFGLSGLIIMASMGGTKLFDLIPEPPSDVFDNSMDGILVLDTQYRLLSANRAANTLLKNKISEQIGKPIYQIVVNFPDIATHFKHSLDSEFIHTYTQDNQTLEMHITSFKDENKSSKGYLIFIRDETIRERTRQEIQLTQRKYTSLFKNMLDGAILLHTSDHGQTFLIGSINKSAEKYFNCRPPEIIGKNIVAFYGGEGFGILRQSILQVWQSGESIQIPPIKSIFGDNVIWREFVLYKFSDNEVVILCKDITEEMRTKEKLTLINKDLEMYVNQLEDFSSDILYLNQFGSKLQSSQTYIEVADQVRRFSTKLFPAFIVNLVIINNNDQSVLYSDLSDTPLFVQEFLPLNFLGSLPSNTIHEFNAADFEPYQTIQDNQPFHADKFPFQFFVCRFGEDKMAIFTVDTQSIALEQKQRQHILSVCERLIMTLSNLDLQEQLKYQALHDEITGFYNRRYMNESLPREFHRAERYHRPLSFIMLDVDHFKQFNDTYGHVVGDQILKEISKVIQSMTRKSDLVFRYGGEEFLIVLPETDLNEAVEKAQAIAKMIHSMEVEWNHAIINTLSISGGVSNYPKDAQSIEDLITCADEAMYKAKENGRDQIFIYSQNAPRNSNVRPR